MKILFLGAGLDRNLDLDSGIFGRILFDYIIYGSHYLWCTTRISLRAYNFLLICFHLCKFYKTTMCVSRESSDPKSLAAVLNCLLSFWPSLFAFLYFLSYQSRKSSSRGKRRRAPRVPLSPAGRRSPSVLDRTPTPAVGQRGTCLRRGSPRSSRWTGNMHTHTHMQSGTVTLRRVCLI